MVRFRDCAPPCENPHFRSSWRSRRRAKGLLQRRTRPFLAYAARGQVRRDSIDRLPRKGCGAHGVRGRRHGQCGPMRPGACRCRAMFWFPGGRRKAPARQEDGDRWRAPVTSTLVRRRAVRGGPGHGAFSCPEWAGGWPKVGRGLLWAANPSSTMRARTHVAVVCPPVGTHVARGRWERQGQRRPGSCPLVSAERREAFLPCPMC